MPRWTEGLSSPEEKIEQINQEQICPSNYRESVDILFFPWPPNPKQYSHNNRIRYGDQQLKPQRPMLKPVHRKARTKVTLAPVSYTPDAIVVLSGCVPRPYDSMDWAL